MYDYFERRGVRTAECSACGAPLRDLSPTTGTARFKSHDNRDCIQRLAEENVALRERMRRIEDSVFGPSGDEE